MFPRRLVTKSLGFRASGMPRWLRHLVHRLLFLRMAISHRFNSTSDYWCEDSSYALVVWLES